MRWRRLRGNEGQALLLVLAFMVLSVPLVTGALALASTLTLDSRVKTRILKSQYSQFGLQQASLHLLINEPGSTTTSFTLNGQTVTTTIVKVSSTRPTVPLESAQARLATSKTASPTSTSAGGTITYTITVVNSKDDDVDVEQVIDELPPGFSFVTSSTSMRDPNNVQVSTADPAKVIRQLIWTVPATTTLAAGETMTVTFQALAATTAGVYCNEAFVYPGGSDTTSGKTANVTVGTPLQAACVGGLVSVDKTVNPAIRFSNISTTHTYLIQVENKGTAVVNIKDLTDVTSAGLTYLVDTTSSSLPFTPLEPQTDPTKNEIKWEMDGVGLELPTSTTWFLQFSVYGTLDSGFYPDIVELSFAGASFATPAQDQFCVFSNSSLTVLNGASVGCSIGSNSDILVDNGVTISGDVVSLTGDITIQNNSVVTGDVVALGGSITIQNNVTIQGSVLAAGSVILENNVVVQGNVVASGDVTGGDFVLENNATVGGYIWAGGDVTFANNSLQVGDVISGGNVDLENNSSVGGDVFAEGTITVGDNASVGGTSYPGASVPAAPPIDLESSGPTAVITVLDDYRITTTDGSSTSTCDVWISSDVDTGIFGFIDGCSS